MNLNELEIKLPRFDVYKSFILPYRYDGDEIVDVLKVDEDIVKDWKKMLSNLHEFLIEGLTYGGSANLSEVEKIELINDLISIFLKIPLLRELLPTIVPSPLKLYLFYRLNETLSFEELKIKEDILDYVYAFYDRTVKERFTQTAISRFFDNIELCELVERCWFRIPADTRPGLNTCGLIPHILLSSAIAWALAVKEGLSRSEVAIITLATLLHDLGKPIRYTDHVNASKEIAKELLQGLLSREIINEVVRLIELHHADEPSIKVEIIRKADQISSRIDRLYNLFKNLLKDELEKLSKETGIDIYRGYESKDYAWDVWEKLHRVKPEAIMELSKTFVRKIRESLEDFRTVVRVAEVKNVEGVLMCLADIGSIQEFIMTASRLRVVAASSLVVDTLTISLIPLEIQKSTLPKYRIPLSNIVYAAGGVVEFIIPENIYGNVLRVLDGLNKITSKINLPIRVASTVLKDYYPETILELAAEIQLAKLKVDSSRQHIMLNRSKEVRNLCRICYSRPPTTEVQTPEGIEKTCRICRRLYEIGSEIHFKPRYESDTVVFGHLVSPRKLFKREWDAISRYILEVIAGHDDEELEKLEERRIEYRDLAVIKLDGNLIGPFMASSVSLTDACERSARIDLALKKALDKAIKQVFEAVREVSGDNQALKTILQIMFGLMYAGGDDALIFVPSWSSIGFALVVGEEFQLNMGRARGLAIGLATGKSTADIWSLISAASKLMEESKKRIGRNEPSSNCICFDTSDTLTLTGASVISHLEDLRKENLTVQPLRFDGETPNFKQLISLTISEDLEPKKVFRNCYLLSRPDENDMKKEVNDMKEEIKHVRRAITESLSVARSMVEKVKGLEDYLIPLSATYAYRQACRKDLSEKARRGFEIVTKLHLSKNGVGYNSSMYSDADRLIKISGGGML